MAPSSACDCGLLWLLCEDRLCLGDLLEVGSRVSEAVFVENPAEGPLDWIQGEVPNSRPDPCDKDVAKAAEDRGGIDRLGEANRGFRVGPEGDCLPVGVGGEAWEIKTVPRRGVARESKDCDEGGSELSKDEGPVGKAASTSDEGPLLGADDKDKGLSRDGDLVVEKGAHHSTTGISLLCDTLLEDGGDASRRGDGGTVGPNEAARGRVLGAEVGHVAIIGIELLLVRRQGAKGSISSITVAGICSAAEASAVVETILDSNSRVDGLSAPEHEVGDVVVEGEEAKPALKKRWSS